jgi:hypothetical protein
MTNDVCSMGWCAEVNSHSPGGFSVICVVSTIGSSTSEKAGKELRYAINCGIIYIYNGIHQV